MSLLDIQSFVADVEMFLAAVRAGILFRSFSPAVGEEIVSIEAALRI